MAPKYEILFLTGWTSAQELRQQILTSAQVIHFGTVLFHGAEVKISIELGAEVHSLVTKLLPCRTSIALFLTLI